MFAKRKVNRNVRQKVKESSPSSSSDDSTESHHKKQKTLNNNHHQHSNLVSLKSIKKKKQKNSLLSASTNTKHSKSSLIEIEKGEDANALAVKFNASGTATSLVQDTATRILDVDGPLTAEENLQDQFGSTSVKDGDIFTPGEDVYLGMEGYKEYVNKKTSNVNQISASRIRAGPLKGVTNVRISCRFDYQPDVCKDYKETGYCGYGDSCKFMHDRGDYKSGWELDKEWDKNMAAGLPLDGDNNEDEKWLIKSDDEKSKGEEDDLQPDSDEDEDDGLPFACYICRNDFKNPVVTKCAHYFCEVCAIKQNAKSPKCFACGLPTNGIFNVAKDLVKRIQERNKRREEKEKQIRETLEHQDFDAELSSSDEEES